MLFHGDSLEVLKAIDDNSVDSVVTDPPAGIGFMGKEWDHHKGGRDEWISWLASILKECHRVLKPGGHALVWSIPRTSHWTGMACEHAGFEVRDQISHIFSSGFPKSLNVGKALDKEAGIEREAKPITGPNGKVYRQTEQTGWKPSSAKCQHTPIGENSCDLAKKWDGFGTSLKPSREDWWLVRKPLSESTVAKNVVKHGTGALNIDGSRIEAADQHVLDAAVKRMTGNDANNGEFQNSDVIKPVSAQGRWPSHTLFDEEAAAVLDEQSGERKSGGYKDSGGASRFFYVAKASKSERNKGCEGMPEKAWGTMGDIKTGSGNLRDTKRQNFHPTVKSIKLMEYLIKLITPPNGTVLDPFMGSGSTGVAAKNLGMGFIGIERELEYLEIAQARLK